MIGNTLAIVLPLAALLIAGLSIAGIWYWWTSGRDTGESELPVLSEQEKSPTGEAASYTGSDDKLEGSFFTRLADSFKPQESGTVPTQLPSSPASDIPPSPPPLVPVSDTVEVMRVLRDLADGSLVVEVNGQQYRRIADITDAQVGRRFIGNAKALAQFARLGALNIPDEWAELPVGDASLLPTPTPPTVDEWQGASYVPPPTPPTQSESGRRSGLFGSKRAEEEEVAPALSVAEQIESLLQHRLSGTPDLVHRSIHIRPSLDGGVRIEVDGKFYEGVGEVTDQQIKEFIQSTIREWEARQ